MPLMNEGSWRGAWWTGPSFSSCAQFSNGLDLGYLVAMGVCNSPHQLIDFRWDALTDSVMYVQRLSPTVPLMRLPGDYYSGYPKLVSFPSGATFAIDGVVGHERRMTTCWTAPVSATGYQNGDVCFNAQAAAIGDILGWRLLSGTWIAFNDGVLPAMLFGSLPPATAVGAGVVGWITDSPTTYGSTTRGGNASGGGSNGTPVVSNGTNWIYP